MLHIRRYQSQDRTSVKTLYLLGLNRFSASEKTESYLIETPDLDNVEETYLSQRGEFLVGIEDNRLVAMGGMKSLSEKSAELKRMAVHPDYRRNGYGQAILRRLLDVHFNLVTQTYIWTRPLRIYRHRNYTKN